MAEIQITLLGTVRITVGEQSIVLTSPGMTALLGYLALHASAGRGVARETIAATLYPDLAPSQGRRALNDALFRLRRTCGESAAFIESTDDALAMSRVWLDIESFRHNATAPAPQQWQAAISLYRGDLLEQIDADWLLGPRILLRDLHLATLARLCAQLLDSGDPTEALIYAHHWVRADPLNEGAHCAIMRLYQRLGRPAAALQQYEALVELLEKELQSRPLPETRALAGAIRSLYGAIAPQPSLSGATAPDVLASQILPDVRPALEVAAILGRSFTRQMWHAVADESTIAALDMLVSGGWLHEDEGDFSFARPGLSAALDAAIDPERRRDLLQRLSSALRRALHPAPPALPVRLARRDAPLGKTLGASDYVVVRWTVDAGDVDAQILAREGKIALRRRRIVRLLHEAAAQGGVPTDQNLAAALGVSERTIESDIAALHAAGVGALTRRRRKAGRAPQKDTSISE